MADINRSTTNMIQWWALPNQKTDNKIAQPITPAQPLIPTQQVVDQMWTYANDYSGQPLLANQFKVLGNELTDQDKLRNQIANFYGLFEQNMNPQWDRFMQLNQWVGDEIIGQLNQNRQVFESQYWPQGAQSNRLNQYYNDLGNYLVANSADAQAQAEADAIASWASIGARRAAQNAVEKEQFDAMMKAQQQEIKDYESLYKTVNDYLNEFVKVYGDTKDKYTIDTYKQLLDFKNQLGTALVNANVALATTWAAAGSGTWSWSSTGSGTGAGTATSTGSTGTFTWGEGTAVEAAPRTTPSRSSEAATGNPTNVTYGEDVTPVMGGVTGYAQTGNPLTPVRPVEWAARSTDAAVARRQQAPTIVPTNRQISDYIAGRSSNMSPELINAIKYYINNGLANVPTNALKNPQAQAVQANGYPINSVTTLMPAGSQMTDQFGRVALVPNAYRPVESTARTTQAAVARRQASK